MRLLGGQVGKAYAGRAAKAANRKEALALAEEGSVTLAAAFSKGAPAVDALCTIARQLRRLPAVEPYLPTVSFKALQLLVPRYSESFTFMRPVRFCTREISTYSSVIVLRSLVFARHCR